MAAVTTKRTPIVIIRVKSLSFNCFSIISSLVGVETLGAVGVGVAYLHSPSPSTQSRVAGQALPLPY